MALSRTARILIAILLLAAAAFFWVNFFYQSRLAEAPAQDPVTATPATPGSEATAEGEAVPADDAAAGDGDAATAAVDPDAAADPDAIAVADPEVVAIDPAIAVTRDVVIADLPFLVTEPPAAEVEAEAETEDPAAAGVTVATRATINPFSPVVVRTPPAPARDVPAAIAAAGEVAVEVPVPAGPPPAPIRQAAPTPRAITPPAPSATLNRDLPSGAVLSSAPALLRQPRVGTVADRVDLPAITAIAVPDPEPAVIAPPSAPRPAVPVVDLEPVGPFAGQDPTDDTAAAAPTTSDEPAAPSEPGAEEPATVATEAPLAVGTTRLARFLRDNDYAFTGSVLGPVSVGVFRSNLDAAPIVVSLGQTLPNTEIVLTDLRGMQAELTLGHTTQILTLDLRR